MNKKEHVKVWLKKLNRLEMQINLATIFGNLGVVGIGIAFWQKGDWASWAGGILCLVASLITSGMVKK